MRLLPVTPDDLPFLWEMLGQAAAPFTGRPLNEVDRRHLEGWGRAPHDRGLVAWEGDRRVGAAWGRRLPSEAPGHGWVDDDTPELAVAVVTDARSRGVGRALVAGWLDLEAAHGTPQACLSVATRNERAAALYLSLGFTVVEAREGGRTMVAPTAPPPPGEDGPRLVARSAVEDDGPAVARLRRIMFDGMGVTGGDDWVAPLLGLWPGERASGRWHGALVPGPDGRPVAGALAVTYASPPGPGRPHGRVAHVGSVATEPTWRRRGAARAAVSALLTELDRLGVESATLNASPDGAELYRSLGFAPAQGRALRRPHPDRG